jgi:hypothetical protein
MEKTPPVTGKRRGGSRKACNECKQQKVSHTYIPHYYAYLPNENPRPSGVVDTCADLSTLYS